jgi:hypothetical protein
MLTRKNVGITSKNFDEKMLAPLLKNVGKLLKNVGNTPEKY